MTRAASWVTYLTIGLMADRRLVDDCYRTYAYFRWADDVVDVRARDRQERLAFAARQKALVDRLYRGEGREGLTPEEEMIADAIGHDRGAQSGLRSFVRNILAILEFDARRRGQPVSRRELEWYSSCLGKAVTDDIQYFVGNGHPYPDSAERYRAATAAHVTHMLRDLVPDLAEGYVNIPAEYLASHGVADAATDLDTPAIRDWVREQAALARRYFRQGKDYLDGLDVLRCQITGYWYCARFEAVLDRIERDGYVLRARYDDGVAPTTLLRMSWLAAYLSIRHVARGLPRLVGAILER